MRIPHRKLAVSAVLPAALFFIVQSAHAYDYPLTESAIRDAYFAGSGSTGTDPAFYGQYTHNLAIPRRPPPVSYVSLDTPFLQIAQHVRNRPNYDAQDAVRDYRRKPMMFRVFVEVYYHPKNSDESSGEGDGSPQTDQQSGRIRVRLMQHRKEIATTVTDRWDLNVFHDASSSAVSVSQHIQLECGANKIDSSQLTVEIETPDGQHAETAFDLSGIR